ncbi:MAG TPA: Mut7-C RNAse domain-containing protein, partial [Desulfobaccales bacterium]
MKFLVDLPLGGLAKWLRFCGFDAQVLHLSPGDPKTLPPPQPGTVILTRQEALNRLGRPDVLVLTGRGPEEQLQEVFTLLKISRRRLQTLSRCSRCNEPLAPVHRDQVRGR